MRSHVETCIDILRWGWHATTHERSSERTHWTRDEARMRREHTISRRIRAPGTDEESESVAELACELDLVLLLAFEARGSSD